MRVLLIISSNSPEIKWNAVRLGNVLLDGGEDVTIFLNGPAASFYEGDSTAFPLKEQTRLFVLSEGNVHVCGKCMDIHGVNEDGYLKRSNMKNLYALIREADKIISY